MTWNNRIIKRELAASNGTAELYGLHETYYNVLGGVTTFTQEPMGGYYDTVEDLIKTLEQQLSDAKKYRDDIIVEKGFVFAPEDIREEHKMELMTPAEKEESDRQIREEILLSHGVLDKTEQEISKSQVGAPLSDKLFYAQFASMNAVQIEGVVARAQAGGLCPLICGGQVVGWIAREHRGLLPNLNALVLNQPRPIEAKCPKCQGTDWRYVGCYAVDEFEAHSGFECLGCRHRQYDCFDYRKRPDQSTDGPPGQAQDSGEGSQLGSPS